MLSFRRFVLFAAHFYRLDDLLLCVVLLNDMIAFGELLKYFDSKLVNRLGLQAIVARSKHLFFVEMDSVAKHFNSI